VSAPTAPTLVAANDGTGTSFTATLAGVAGATHTIYYRAKAPRMGRSWTTGLSRVGDGALQQTGLTDTAIEAVAVSSLAGELSLPSLPVYVYLSESGTAVIEQIALRVLARIEELVDDGILAAVQRALRAGLPSAIADKMAVLYQDDAVAAEESPHGHSQWTTAFAIDVYVKPSDASTTPVDTTVNDLCARVQRKIMEDRLWGGLALWTRIVAAESFALNDGSAEGVRVWFEVGWRTRETDPFTQT